MSETPIISNMLRSIDTVDQPGPNRVRESSVADIVGTGNINIRIRPSRIELSGRFEIPPQDHDIHPPTPNALEGSVELKSIIDTPFDMSIDILSLMATLAVKMHATMSELHTNEHKLMNQARGEYAKSIHKKVNNMHKQAENALAFGLSSSIATGMGTAWGAKYAFGKGVQPQEALAKSQTASGFGGSVSGIIDASGKGVDINIEARNVKLDFFAQNFQSFQAEFKDSADGTKQKLQEVNQLLADAGNKRDTAIGVIIGKMS